MKRTHKPSKAGKGTPQNDEARSHGGGAGLEGNQKHKHRNDSERAPKGKAAVDSRTTIAKAIEVTSPERIALLHDIRDAHPGNSVQVQCDRMLAVINQSGHVSTFEAMRYCDIFDPRARKLNLIKMGHSIDKAWRWVATESGDHHHVGVYFMSLHKVASSDSQPDLFTAAFEGVPA